jgi:hypothetical protein
MTKCQIEDRNAGRAYPRTCPTCGSGGHCKKALTPNWMQFPAPTLRDAPMSDAAVEAVARAFCKRMGLDPDEVVDVVGKMELPVLEWGNHVGRAREAIAMHLAMKDAGIAQQGAGKGGE